MHGDEQSKAMTRKTLAVAALLAGCLLVAATPAQAIYLITPLNIDPSSAEADVGDGITFTLTPNDEYEGASYAGQTVTIRYSFDPEEGQRDSATYPEDPDGTVSSDDEPRAPDEEWEDTTITRDVGPVSLDAESRATFSWTVPEEVDDRNVFVTVVAEDDTTLARAHVRVGDAEPMHFLASESSPRDLKDDGALSNDDAQADDFPQETGEGRSSIPAPGLVAALVATAAIALALRRSRS